jgi:DNA invertase Pin-like site-specific DNA recombinase
VSAPIELNITVTQLSLDELALVIAAARRCSMVNVAKYAHEAIVAHAAESRANTLPERPSLGGAPRQLPAVGTAIDFHRRKLGERDKEIIRQQFDKGLNITSIARRWGVSPTTIKRAIEEGEG